MDTYRRTCIKEHVIPNGDATFILKKGQSYLTSVIKHGKALLQYSLLIGYMAFRLNGFKIRVKEFKMTEK
jgi:hypothetical protein